MATYLTIFVQGELLFQFYFFQVNLMETPIATAV